MTYPEPSFLTGLSIGFLVGMAALIGDKLVRLAWRRWMARSQGDAR